MKVWSLILLSHAFSFSAMPRKNALRQIAALMTASVAWQPHLISAFAVPAGENFPSITNGVKVSTRITPTQVAYRAMSIEAPGGVTVPVAMWYPVEDNDMQRTTPIMDYPKLPPRMPPQTLKYTHRISVRRIGQLLAGWEFIPSFASRGFELAPTTPVMDGSNSPFPTRGPVVLLAHGYLGSRFDLSHIAEALAREGFICVSAEYPESLAASYENGIASPDREQITSQLLLTMTELWGITPTGYGIVGHSLGTGTAMSVGDAQWARVCLAGFPRRFQDGSSIPGNALFISSMNDGAVSPARFGGASAIPTDFAMLSETVALNDDRIPPRSFLLFDRPDAPNHISFLADGVNQAMIELLSPLLPVAQMMNIPVLDFDKYKESRDSQATADIVIPLVTKYLKQQMKV